MPVENFISFAFSGGVMSETFEARSDLEKFDLGMREGYNFYVDYRGGASVRAPLEFLDYLAEDAAPMRLVPFKFNDNLANNYLILFYRNGIRFIQDGAYVLEADKSVTAVTAATTTEVTSSAHGLSNGDWIKFTDPGGRRALAGQTFVVSAVTPNTFEIALPYKLTFDTSTESASTSGTFARVYTISSPYDVDDLRALTFDQFRDEIYITGTSYPPRKLTRFASANWSLALVTFTGNTAAPVAPTITGSGAGTAGVIYAVTSVNLTGEESFVKEIGLTETAIDISNTTGSIRLTWPIVANTKEYKVYRSLIYPKGADITFGQQLGYIGRTIGPSFTDTNIVPDFASPPPTAHNPFAPGAVQHLNITAGGSGYAKTGTTVSISGGSGFIGLPVVDDTGAVIAILVLQQGTGYTDSETVTISGTGTGATATVVTKAASGTYPATTVQFQQRRVYLGTTAQPVTFFASVPGKQDNFDYTAVGSPSDSYELTLDAEELTPIKYATKIPGGLFIFTADSIHQLRGDGEAIVIPENATADPRSATGVGDVKPLLVEDNVVYVRAQSSGVKALRPSPQRNYYEMVDLSIFSNQYFQNNNPVVAWTNAPTPYRLIYCARADGTLLIFTYVPEQNVYAWTDGGTAGEFHDVATVRENAYDRTYAIVARNGRKFLERFGTREINSVEDLGAVDSALSTKLTYPSGGGLIRAAAANGNSVPVTATASVFSAADVGKHLRMGYGRATVTTYVSPTEILVDWVVPMTYVAAETKEPRAFASGTWSLTSPVSEVTGLQHLEGQVVQVFADGNELADAVVTDGVIPIIPASSRITVGLGYSAVFSSLPLTASNMIIEDKKKRVTDASIRLLESRGLVVGAYNSGIFYDIKERTFENYGQPTNMIRGQKEISVTQAWDDEGSITVKKAGPMLATILGVVLNVDIGSD